MEISFIVMTYNRKDILKGCLDSLRGQDFPKDAYEILVVDDGSTDGTEALVTASVSDGHNIRYIRQGHGGVSKARNTGYINSKGRITAFIADDYIIPRNYAGEVTRFFRENRGAGVVRFKIENRNNKIIDRVSQHHYETAIRSLMGVSIDSPAAGFIAKIKKPFFRMPKAKEAITISYNLPASGAAAFRREVFEMIGLFDEGLKGGEDSDMGLRLRIAGIGVFYNPFVKIARIYESNIGNTLVTYFSYGKGLYDFKRKHPRHSIRLPNNFKNCLFYIANILFKPIWVARQADSAKDFFLFFPFVFMMNLAYTLGVFYKQAAATLKKLSG